MSKSVSMFTELPFDNADVDSISSEHSRPARDTLWCTGDCIEAKLGFSGIYGWRSKVSSVLSLDGVAPLHV
jgi:hypothetical protein